ncbi:MAG TPA: ABC transporter permease, partial [Flavisolibacter sp.]
MADQSELRSVFSEAGGLSAFAGRFFGQFYKPRYEFREFIRQCFIIGYQSLPLIGLTAFIMGLVLTIQLRPSLVDYGVESQLPSMISLAIIRELGPVITALIFAGKIGSSIGAELGSMRVTEQIDAMEVSGTNPFKYLV